MKYLLHKYKKNNHLLVALLLLLMAFTGTQAQDSYVGDGFGGRSWYKPSNFSVGGNVASLNVNGQVNVWGVDNITGFHVFPAPVTYMDKQGVNYASVAAISAVPAYIWIQPVSTLNNVKLISFGLATNSGTGSGAVKTDGSGWVWGTTAPFINTPTMVFPNNCKFVNGDAETISFIKNDGSVWTVGKNAFGEFGNGSAPTSTGAAPSLVPVQMNITNAVRVAAFSGRSSGFGIAVLKNDGTVWITGNTADILSASGATVKTTNPIQVTGLSNIVDIKCAKGAVIALSASGDVYIASIAQIRKLTFPTGAKPIVAIKANGYSFDYFCLDEGHTLYTGTADLSAATISLSVFSTDAHVSAYYVNDVSSGLKNNDDADLSISYLVRTSDYPANDRIWVSAPNCIYKLNDQIQFESNGQVVVKPAVETRGMSEALDVSPGMSWLPTRLSVGGGGGFTDTTAGTIDCAKTQLYPAPVAGTASQVDLIVTVNVTTPGCFTPLTVSGSGFSIASGFTQKCVTATGIQQLHIPVNYDGSTLGTLTFTVGQAGTCTADLTKQPADKLVKLWTLDNCTLKNAPPALK